jgi:hypothetical protein
MARENTLAYLSEASATKKMFYYSAALVMKKKALQVLD